MIKVLDKSHDDILAVEAFDKLTHEDYEQVWVPALDKLINEYGQVSCLLYMDEDFKGWETQAIVDDAKFGFKHCKSFKKIALVGGPSYVTAGVKMFSVFLKFEIKCFDTDELEEAWEWLEE